VALITRGKLAKLDAGSKRTWKLHQTVDELQKWSAYLQQSAEKFIEEFTEYNARSVFVTSAEEQAFQETIASLDRLKKESALLKNRSRKLHGQRRG
jgi:hypothetical protein